MVRDVFCKNCDTKLGWMYVSVQIAILTSLFEDVLVKKFPWECVVPEGIHTSPLEGFLFEPSLSPQEFPVYLCTFP